MSLFTPERVPVQVYKWDDAGAPPLNKSAGCMMAIYQACLVTGYGTKASAGWTMPFEDVTSATKVFRPEVGPEKDFYLKVSADTGTQVTAQVYLNMIDANTGDLKLQCATPFKYAKAFSTGVWMLVASPRGFWFFCEQRSSSDPQYGLASNTGAFFNVGDTLTDTTGQRAVHLHHTGGLTDNGSYSSLISFRGSEFLINESLSVPPKLLLEDDRVVQATPHSRWLFNGFTKYTIELHTMQLPIFIENKMYLLSGVFLPSNGAAKSNLDELTINQSAESRQAIVFGSSGLGSNNTYIATDYWEY